MYVIGLYITYECNFWQAPATEHLNMSSNRYLRFIGQRFLPIVYSFVDYAWRYLLLGV